MEITTEIKAAHRELSRGSVDFLEYVLRHPGAMSRVNFMTLLSGTPSGNIPIQPWPTFINRPTKRELSEAAVKVFDLIKSIPERVFDFDSEEIGRYYEIPGEKVEEMFYGCDYETLQSLWGRGDFILSPGNGLKCIEFNVGTQLGGWELGSLETLYLDTQIISGFLKESGMQVCNPNLYAIILENITGRALERFSDEPGGEINVAIITPGNPSDEIKALTTRFNSIYQDFLRQKRPALNGEVVLCDFEHLRLQDNYLVNQQKKIHIVIEMAGGEVPLFLLDAAQEENVVIVNGPISRLIANKMNLALLSENQESELFTPDEKKVIRDYIPWTRKILPGKTTYKNEEIDLEKWIIAHRKELVLKSAVGFGGHDVFIGMNTPEDKWRQQLEQAIIRKNWLVQEFIPSTAYMYQTGEQGCVLHDAEWELFVFGSRCAGGYTRVHPRMENSTGTVSPVEAERSIILEIDERIKQDETQDIIDDEIKKNHALLSKTSVYFLDFVKANPEGLKRSSYSNIDEIEKESMAFQPWPTFISPSPAQYMKEAGAKVYALINSIPERLFYNDIDKLSSYFNLNKELTQVAIETISGGHVHQILSRGDFLLSPAGFKCLEFNISGGIGGWHMPVAQPAFLEVPFIAEFLKHYQIKILNEDLVELLILHILKAAVEKFTDQTHREINTAFVHYKFAEGEGIGVDFGEDYISEVYQRVLAEKYPHLYGEPIYCDLHHLRVVDNHIFCGNKPVHVMLESYHGIIPFEMLVTALLGNVLLYNGPVSILLSNKLNLALLSEHVDSPEFTPTEREIIKSHIPWSRRVAPGEVIFGTESYDMEELLLTQRERLIIKPGSGLAGKGVVIGAYSDKIQWKEIVETELREKQAVVQEYIEAYPYLYQSGECGCSLHNVVWGLFYFGSRYGGGFMRMLERQKDSKGVINVFQGAQAGLILEVDR